VYKVDGEKQTRVAFSDSSSSFFYQTEKGEIKNSTDLENQLKSAAEIFSAFVKAQYKKNEFQLPENDVLVIRPDELVEMEEIRTFKSGATKQESSADRLIIKEKPNVSFEDIGGQDKAVETCKRFSEQLAYPEVFRLQGSEPPRGILLWGPPGTGKTMLAKAIAAESNATFLQVQAGDVVGEGLYGQTEGVVTELFSEAKKITQETGRRVIIFVDEADLILPGKQKEGGGARHEATGRVVGIFSQEMDGIRSSKEITTILATNDPKDLDPKILSRMDESEEVPLPDAKGLERIFEIHLARTEKEFNIRIARDGFDLTNISKLSEEQKLSGRDVKDILGILLRKRGQMQLAKIREAIKTARIPVPDGVNESQVITNVAERLKSGDLVGLEDLQLNPVSESDLKEVITDSKNLLKSKAVRKMGFISDVN
jgi:SpoVK/Ycf46/Vps4 family AAA+-type ATPase